LHGSGGQNPKPGIEIPVSGETKTLAEHLTLTAHQRDALAAFKERYLLGREEVLGYEPLDESDVIQELTENFEVFSEGFTGVLTAEQREKYDAIRAEVIGEHSIQVDDSGIQDKFWELMDGGIIYRTESGEPGPDASRPVSQSAGNEVDDIVPPEIRQAYLDAGFQGFLDVARGQAAQNAFDTGGFEGFLDFVSRATVPPSSRKPPVPPEILQAYLDAGFQGFLDVVKSQAAQDAYDREGFQGLLDFAAQVQSPAQVQKPVATLQGASRVWRGSFPAWTN